MQYRSSGKEQSKKKGQEVEKPRPAYYQGNIKFSQEFEAEAARCAKAASRSAQPRREMHARKRNADKKDNGWQEIDEEGPC